MTGAIMTGNSLFTEFTFAILEDTGYIIKNKSIDFIE